MRNRALNLLSIGVFLAAAAACAPNQNPDQLREKTAQATAAVKRDTKAIAEGVKDGLTQKRSVDLNKATKDDLAGLPGMTSEKADRIVAERPYANTRQLVTRHVLSDDDYEQIKDRIVVSH